MCNTGPFFADSILSVVSTNNNHTHFCMKWDKVGLTPIDIGRIVETVGKIGTFWEGYPDS